VNTGPYCVGLVVASMYLKNTPCILLFSSHVNRKFPVSVFAVMFVFVVVGGGIGSISPSIDAVGACDVLKLYL